MPDSTNQIGKIILGYKVDHVIGSGGFGTVYKVSKTNASGHYESALKHIVIPNETQFHDVLNSMGGDYSKADNYFKSVLNDIVSEINILQSLSEKNNHHIINYFDNEVLTQEEPLRHDIFIRMELVTALPKYLKENKFTLGDVLDLGINILSALELCHSNGIIHRDIKDDNIFVNKEKIFKVGDFGVAKLLKDKSRAASMKGTPAFLAPEVFAGREYDHTVDLYSLGTVIYKLLNHARLPFLPPFPEIYEYLDLEKAIERRQSGEIPERPLNAPRELGDILVKACSPRENRFNSAKEFSIVLSQVKKSLSHEELNKIVNEPVASHPSTIRDLSQQKTLGTSYSPGRTSSQEYEETIANQLAYPSCKKKRTEQQSRHSESEQSEDLFGTFGRPVNNPRLVEEYPHLGTNTESENSAQRERETQQSLTATDRARSQQQSQIFQNPDTYQRPVKTDFSWLVYLSPVVIAIIAIIYYMNILSFLKDIPLVGTIASKGLFSLLLSVSFITSLFFAGKKIQEKKTDTSISAELTGKEAYYKMLDISGMLTDLKGTQQGNAEKFMQVLKIVKQLEELLKIEPDFGYGKASIIQLENEIAAILFDMKGLAESLTRREPGQIQQIEQLVTKVNNLLRRRREILKR